MSASPVISPANTVDVQDVSKVYRIWNSPGARLRHPVLNAVGALLPFSKFGLRNPKHAARSLFHEFWALRPITLQIPRGQSLGLVGRNGAGKSTLLQIIAGTLRPTTGTAETVGRLAALLELGSGFNPEFTGRENAHLNAAILGLSREEIAERFDEIVAFADIGEFIDQPVKSYSSGMRLRLAFAVQIAIEPSVLIVDEALAVGDIFFVQKCFDRLRKLREGGTTLLFVSHSLPSIVELCDRAIWLEQGEMRMDGTPKEVAQAYSRHLFKTRLVSAAENPSPQLDQEDPELPRLPPRMAAVEKALPALARQLVGIDGYKYTVSCGLFARNGAASSVFAGDSPALIGLQVSADHDIPDFHIGIQIRDPQGRLIFGTNSHSHSKQLGQLRSGRTVTAIFDIVLALQPGEYTVLVGLASRGSSEKGACDFVHFHEAMAAFSIIRNEKLPPFGGFCRLPVELHLTEDRSSLGKLTVAS